MIEKIKVQKGFIERLLNKIQNWYDTKDFIEEWNTMNILEEIFNEVLEEKNKDELINKIKNILYWNNECLCPLCGNEVHIDGKYGEGNWYGKKENRAFYYCSNNNCKFKHYIEYHNSINDESYLEEIKKLMKNFINE